MRKNIIYHLLLYSLVGMQLLFHSCNKETVNVNNIIEVSDTKAQVQFGEDLSVQLNLKNKSAVEQIKVVKSIDGKVVNGYNRMLVVKDIQFPYTFSESVGLADEDGVVMYSFYALDKSGTEKDAVDVVLYISFGQLYSLIKYDWKSIGMDIAGFDFTDDALRDNVYRFHEDQSLQFDWGTTLTSLGLEVFLSHCAWKVIEKDSKVDSLHLIRYNIMNHNQDVIKYKVVELKDRKMVLQHLEDWSWLGLGVEEPVLTTLEGSARSANFAPNRGQNPNSYVIPACRPGTY